MREAAEGKPVQIGQLQRYATDVAMARGQAVLRRAPRRPARRVAVVGAGPAGLACAHRLAMHGHDVVIFDARPKAGGLNEYGIAAYKTRRRLRPGRGRLRHRHRRHHDRERQGARPRLHARRTDRQTTTRCSSASALPASTRSRAEGEDADGVDDAVDFIADLRQATRPVDAAGRPPRRRHRRRHDRDRRRRAVEAARRRGGDHRLSPRQGADERLRLRAGPRASQGRHHPPLAAAEARHRRGRQGHRHRVRIHRRSTTASSSAPARPSCIAADQVFKAIGQTFDAGGAERQRPSIALEAGRIEVDAEGRTSLAKRLGRRRLRRRRRGPDRHRRRQGRDAAESINRALDLLTGGA